MEHLNQNSVIVYWVSAVRATVDNCLIVGPTFFFRPSESQTLFQRFYVDLLYILYST